MRGKQAAAWGLIAAVAAVGAVGGCGGDDGGSSDGGDEALMEPPPDVRSCELLTMDEVNALIGSSVTRGPDQNGDSCRWMAETAGGIGTVPAQHWVELEVSLPITTLDGVLPAVDGESESIADLGDEARLVLSGPNAVTPTVIAGYADADRIVALRYEVQLADGAVDLRPRADALVELLRRVDRRASGDRAGG